MADLSDALIMQFSADISAVEKQMKRLQGVVKGSATNAENAFKKVPKAWGDAAEKGVGNARAQVMELEHVLRSSVDALASGANPMRVLAQEGSRLAQVLANGGLGGVLKGLVGIFPPVVLGVAAIGAALYAAVSAARAYTSEQRQTVVALLGTAAASGLTVDGMEKLVNETDKLNHLSEQATRKVALIFANTGVEGADNIKKSVQITEDLAVSLGVKAPQAAETLAKALERPAEGVKTLNDIFRGFVSGPQMRMIENFAATGREAQAQAVILEALQARIAGNADEMSALDKAMRGVGAAFANATHNVGEFFAKLAGYHGLDELAGLKKQAAILQAEASDPKNSAYGRFAANAQLQTLNQTIAPLQSEQDKIDARDKTAQANVDSQRLQEVKDRADPSRARIEQLTSDVQRLTQALADDVRNKAAPGRIAEDRQYLSGAQANLARAQHREDHIPGAGRAKGPGSDTTAEFDRSTADQVSEGQKAYADAQKALTEDLQARAKAEKAAIDDSLQKKLTDLEAESVKIAGEKNDKDKATQQARIKEAEALARNTAALQKEAIDRKTAADLIEQASAALQQEYKAQQDGLTRRQTYDNAMAELAISAASRVSYERDALQAAQQREQIQAQAEVDLALATLAAATAMGDRAKIKSAQGGLDVAVSNQQGLAVQQGLQTQLFNKQNAGPLDQWVQAAQKSSGDVGTALQNEAVKGINDFNQALANSIVNSKNFGQAFRSIIKSIESDLIELILKQGEVGIFGAASSATSGGGFNLASAIAAVIPHFAAGTSGAPGGLSLVGENGPELVNLPAGAGVTPNNVLRSLAGAANMRASTSMTIGGPQFNLKGAVVTQDLIDQMSAISSQHAQQAALVGATQGHKMTMDKLASTNRYRMR